MALSKLDAQKMESLARYHYLMGGISLTADLASRLLKELVEHSELPTKERALFQETVTKLDATVLRLDGLRPDFP